MHQRDTMVNPVRLVIDMIELVTPSGIKSCFSRDAFQLLMYLL